MTDAFGMPKVPSSRGFGDIEHRKYAALQGQSLAMHEAATNLLSKAVRALGNHQPDKALGYVRRAGRLPYDDYGGASPLALAAHMYVFNSVLDVHELGEGVWLDAADRLLDRVSTRNPLALADFRQVLTVVQDDYGTTPAEDRLLRRMLADQQVATIRDMQELAGEELCSVAIGLLELTIDYDAEVEAILHQDETDD